MIIDYFNDNSSDLGDNYYSSRIISFCICSYNDNDEDIMIIIIITRCYVKANSFVQFLLFNSSKILINTLSSP